MKSLIRIQNCGMRIKLILSRDVLLKFCPSKAGGMGRTWVGMLQIGITVKPETKQTWAQSWRTPNFFTWKHNHELQTWLNPAELNYTRILSVSNLIAPLLRCCHACDFVIMTQICWFLLDPNLRWISQPFLATWDNALILWPGKCLKCFCLELTQIVSDSTQHQCSFPADVLGWFTILNGGRRGGYV